MEKNETHLTEPLLPGRETSSGNTAPAATPVSKWIIGLAISFFVIYLVLGVSIYLLFQDQFSTAEKPETATSPFIDALYFSVVTMCTAGYGDIVPTTSLTKLLTAGLIAYGVISLEFSLFHFLGYVLDLQERVILARINTASSRNRAIITEHIVDGVNGKIRIWWKLGLAFVFVIICVGAGTLFLSHYQELSFVDSLYLSVISVTTVGYGDYAFNKFGGRLFATGWLLVSSTAMATLLYYIAQKRFDASMTVMSEYEYIVRKLQETGKISEDEVNLLSREYKNLDTSPQVVDDGN